MQEVVVIKNLKGESRLNRVQAKERERFRLSAYVYIYTYLYIYSIYIYILYILYYIYITYIYIKPELKLGEIFCAQLHLFALGATDPGYCVAYHR